MSSSTNIVYDYKVGVKREIEEALQNLFGPTYPDTNLRNKVKVHLDFPLEQQQYPAVYLTYNEQTLESAGIGHTESGYDNNGMPVQLRHWRFTGRLNFNVLGRSALERDMVASGIINLLSFGRDTPAFKSFYEDLFNGEFVKLQVLTDSVQPGGEGVTNAPWNTEDERLYTTQYSVPVFGEFWNDPQTGGLIVIENVTLMPYRPDQPVPTGATDPAPWI